jgi:microcystin-dependent protein
MADPFVAEIRIFGFNFAPKGWAFCNGQLMPIAQNTAVFSLLGTTYGGDGKSTFALPDLQGHAPMHPGQGPGLSPHDLGEIGGNQTVTLLESEIPAHSHVMRASLDDANLAIPQSTRSLAKASVNLYNTSTAGGTGLLAMQGLTIAGGSLPHNNMQPYLTLNFCIALQGVFPARP